MELKTLYAERVKDKIGHITTILYNDNKKQVAEYCKYMQQPHKNKKTIVHNCFTYKLVWL